MNLVFFIGWVLLIFICSDLVGSALQFRLPLIYSHLTAASNEGGGTDHRDAPIDFVHSTLLGFSTIWVVLSASYALGIATQQVIAAIIGFSTLIAVLTQYRHVLSLARSRLMFWGLVAVAAFLASFVTPTFNGQDDPEYFFLINKLLGTGSVVEYFNYRRPVTLGGWTFIQAVFSSGPAGITFVASIDAVLGSILFLFSAFLLGLGTGTALQAALTAVLVVQVFQHNLGPATSMAAVFALLTALSLPSSAPRNSFTPTALAVMAYTIRPQLGLIAIFGIAVVLWRNRSKSFLTVGAVLAGILVLWLLVFLRDTGLLPLSRCPGTNPQLRERLCDAQLTLTSWQIISVWKQHWLVFTLTMLAGAICGWKSAISKHNVGLRSEFPLLSICSVAVVVTVFLMIAAIGSSAADYSWYFVPIVEGYLYVVLIRSAVHIFLSRPNRPWMYTSLPIAVATAALSLTVILSLKELSVPSESPRKICSYLLTPEERQQFGQVSHGKGYTLLQIDCPVDSFENSSRIMMSDLFSSTHGDYFDIAWDAEKTLSWLQKRGVDQVVYLDKDSGNNFGFEFWRRVFEKFKSRSDEFAIQWTRNSSYEIKSLENLRNLAEYCSSPRIAIRDPQGPLVIVDIRQCKDQSAFFQQH